MDDNLLEIVLRYRDHLETVDRWFDGCRSLFAEFMSCGAGCSECCRGIFDITLLDAALVRIGFENLPESERKSVLRKSLARLSGFKDAWPDFENPWILNKRPEEEWETIMPDSDETPCLFLSDAGRCLIYGFRPMTCRLHGIPMVESDGEVTFDEWCSLNFVAVDPLSMPGLRFDFRGLFSQEQMLFREFTKRLTGEELNELDTLIPAAVMIDFNNFGRLAWKSGS